MAELEQEHMARESDLLAHISDLESWALSYEERIDGLVSTNTKLHEALRSQELGSGSRDGAIQRQLNAALQHQATLNSQIATLQGELCTAHTAAESSVTVVAEHDASIALIMKQLKKALEDKTMASIAQVQADAVVTKIGRSGALRFK
jgi:hypothetical protein